MEARRDQMNESCSRPVIKENIKKAPEQKQEMNLGVLLWDLALNLPHGDVHQIVQNQKGYF